MFNLVLSPAKVYRFAAYMQIFPLQEKIENINDQYWTLRAEEVINIVFNMFFV